MIYQNTPFLKQALRDGKRFPTLVLMSEFVLDGDEFLKHKAELILQQCKPEQLEDRAAFRCLTIGIPPEIKIEDVAMGIAPLPTNPVRYEPAPAPIVNVTVPMPGWFLAWALIILACEIINALH